MSSPGEESVPGTSKQEQPPSLRTDDRNHTNNEKVIFVTVGTTLFSSLIDNIINRHTINYMIQNNYTHLIIQYGKDQKPKIDPVTVLPEHARKIHIELYDFKPSLYDDMYKASIIICHAGAGTLTEAIRISQAQMRNTTTTAGINNNNHDTTLSTKKIVTVINQKLMDNHQTELAYALQRRHLVHVIEDPEQFASSDTVVWDQIDAFVPSTSTSLEGNPYDVPRIIHQFLGNRILGDYTVANAEKEEWHNKNRR